MADEPQVQLTSPSKRGKKPADEVSVADSESTTPSTAGSEEDTDADTTATSVDDGLPHPRVCPPTTKDRVKKKGPITNQTFTCSLSNPAVNSISVPPTSGRRS